MSGGGHMNRFSVLNKASPKQSNSVVDVEGGGIFGSVKMMMEMGHDEGNHNRPFSSHGDGPTLSMIKGGMNSIIYSYSDLVTSHSASELSSGAVGVKTTTTTTTTLQAFNISSSKTTAQTSSKAPAGGAGGIMAATTSMGFPFTQAQWKELERQAMIYKYMVASVPVPHELLIPIITRNQPGSALGCGLNLRFSKGGDLEPWRCRRTDGKKWRCAREVAPDQKYCERHMHRGRPRSRKHVELGAGLSINSKKTRQNSKTVLPPSHNIAMAINNHNNADENGSSSQSPFVGAIAQPFHGKLNSLNNTCSSFRTYKETRGLDWMLKEGDSSTSSLPLSGGTEQQWRNFNFVQNRREITEESFFCNSDNASLLNRSYLHQETESLNLNSIYSNISCGEDEQSNGYSFIDAWSIGKISENKISNPVADRHISSMPSQSSLTLSMGGNSNTSFEDESGRIQMGLNVIESSITHDNNSTAKLNDTNWLLAPAPPAWRPTSTPGGPLAEVLRSSSVASNPQSPVAGNMDSGSPSSQSGVLQRMSDSSGNSSPDLGSSRVKPGMGVVWLNQDKVHFVE